MQRRRRRRRAEYFCPLDDDEFGKHLEHRHNDNNKLLPCYELGLENFLLLSSLRLLAQSGGISVEVLVVGPST